MDSDNNEWWKMANLFKFLKDNFKDAQMGSGVDLM
jgi:hypothetical protein